MRGHISLAGIDEVVELLRVEIRMLRIGMQIGLDDQHHPERMRKEPAFMRDVRALGVRMLDPHRADLSCSVQYARSRSIRPREKIKTASDRSHDPIRKSLQLSGIMRSQTRWPRVPRAWTRLPPAAAPSSRRRPRRRAGRVR